MTDETSETGQSLEKPKKKGTFVKGYDPRRNLKGVPRDTIKGRALIRKIGAELIHIKEKQDNGEFVEYDITRAEAMIRLMYSSKAPADKQTLLKALWPGMLKEELDLTSDGRAITFRIVHDDEQRIQNPPAGQVPPEATGGDKEPGEA